MTLDRCDHSLRQWREGSLLDVMFHDEALLNDTTWTQPALFAVEVGLAELLSSWGLRPDVVLGHSVGQFAAACVAGIIGWEDGLRLISERSRLVGSLPAGGAMAAVFSPVAEVEQFIAAHPALSVAAVNGSHTVISGPEKSIVSALAALSENGVTLQASYHFTCLSLGLDGSGHGRVAADRRCDGISTAPRFRWFVTFRASCLMPTISWTVITGDNIYGKPCSLPTASARWPSSAATSCWNWDHNRP